MAIRLVEIEFDAEGKLVAPSQESDVVQALTGGARHIVLLAHGWNNDIAEARTLYTRFLDALEQVDPEAAQTAIAVGLLWPSKRFADKALIPGGAASAMPRDAQDRLVRSVGASIDLHADPLQISDEEGRVTVTERAARHGGGAELLRLFGANSVETGVTRLLNYATYYTMKDRAGRIGRDSVNRLLSRIQSQSAPQLHFHLAGHSFGARMLTAAVDGACKLRVSSLLLLQAAYSHNGLAMNFDGRGANGFFHRVLSERKVAGPILITHSKHDEAVGLAYPLASRLNGCDAAHIGDANDIYGGMGANGARHVDAASLTLDGKYQFAASAGRVFNFNGDAVIESHVDVVKPETAALLAAAIRQANSLPPEGG